MPKNKPKINVNDSDYDIDGKLRNVAWRSKTNGTVRYSNDNIQVVNNTTTYFQNSDKHGDAPKNFNNCHKGDYATQKIKATSSDYDADSNWRKARLKNKKSWRSKTNSTMKHSNDNVEVVNNTTTHFKNSDKHGAAPKNFNNSHKGENAVEIETCKRNNLISNESELLIKSITEYFSKGHLDKAQLILNKAEELYIPADIKVWRQKIQDAKLIHQEENDARRRQKMDSLRSEEKKAYDYIDKAKETIVNRNLVTTNKYLQDALDLITVPSKKHEQEEKNKQYNDQTRKVSDVLENAVQTAAFQHIKKAEQAFFNSNFEEAERLLVISERIHPDEYVAEMIALIEIAKQNSAPKERIENLRKTFFKQSNTEQDYEFNNLDFLRTFKIINGFNKAKELLETIEDLYPEQKAKNFFRQIQNATENQRPSNYNFCDNETTINESNKDEAYKCLSEAKEAFHEGNLEKAERLSKKSERMYPTEEAKALLKDLTRDEYDEYEGKEKEAQYCMELIIPAMQANNFNDAESLIEECLGLYYHPLLEYALDNITRLCIAKMREFEKIKFESNGYLKKAVTALSKGLFEKTKRYLGAIDPQFDDVVKHMFDAIEIMQEAEKNKTKNILSHESDKYLTQAINEIVEGNFPNAEIYLNMSKMLKHDTTTDEMLFRLNQVTLLRKEHSSVSSWNFVLNIPKGIEKEVELIIEMAEKEFVKGHFVKAASILNQPKVFSNKRAKRLRQIIKDMAR